MKKLILILTVLFLTSCGGTHIKEVENKEKETTLEVLNLLQKDTTCYKVVVMETRIIVLDENNLVKYKVDNGSKDLEGTLISIFALVFVVIILLMVLNNL